MPKMNDGDIDKLVKASKKLKNKLLEIERRSIEPIAVVGMACRFPGKSNSIEQYWDFLREGRDGIVEVPISRWNIDNYYDEDLSAPGKMYTRYGGFLEDFDIKKFDAKFFNLSDAESSVMDPQQRLALEVVWEAIENAGVAHSSLLKRNVSIYVGQGTVDYANLSFEDLDNVSGYSNSGISTSVTSGRIAYLLGLSGPALTIDTACSSSLVAIHEAIISLRRSESEIAIVSGVNLMVTPDLTIGFCKAKMLAEDGHCKTFDKDADGYSRGEGCGAVILKRLSDAEKDGDIIHAVIRGSAVNQDGASGGLTVPNGVAQKNVIKDALANSNLEPNQISYIEAHGTGTSLGDPIEVGAISDIYGQERGSDNTLVIGSVKTNFGHLEMAAGIAGLIKVILAMKNKYIPPHLNYFEPNPMMDLDQIPAIIPKDGHAWDSKNSLIAGVSGFAFQGTNAHVVVEEYKAKKMVRKENNDKLYPILFSAKTETSLINIVREYIKYLRCSSEHIMDISYTSAIGRDHYEYRFIVMCNSKDSAISQCEDFLNANKSTNCFESNSENFAINAEVLNKYLDGEDIDWEKEYDSSKYDKCILPNYQFDRTRQWLNDLDKFYKKKRKSDPASSTLLGRITMPTQCEKVVVFEAIYDSNMDFIQDHLIFGNYIVAGAVHISRIIEAAQVVCNSNSINISYIDFMRPMIFDESQVCMTQLIIDKDSKGYTFEIFFKILNSDESDNSDWIESVVGRFTEESRVDYFKIENMKGSIDKTSLSEQSLDTLRRYFVDSNYMYGETFSLMNDVSVGKEYAVSSINNYHNSNKYIFYPGLIDSTFQTIAAPFVSKLYNDEKKDPIIFLGLDQVSIYARPVTDMVCYTKIHLQDENSIESAKADILLCATDGEPIALFSGVKFKSLTEDLIDALDDKNKLTNKSQKYFTDIEWIKYNKYNDVINGGKKTYITIANINNQVDILVANLRLMGHDVCLVEANEDMLNSISRLLSDGETPFRICLVYSDVSESHIENYALCLKLMQFLIDNNSNNIESFHIVTNLAVDIDKDVRNVAQSVVWGLAKVFNIEHPDIGCTIIDLDDYCNIDRIAEALLLSREERYIALRVNELFVSRIRIRDEISDNPKLDELNIYPEKTYIVVGGTGGIGKEFVRYLIAKGAKHLIVVSRSGSINDFAESSSKVTVIKKDVSVYQDILDVFQLINDKDYPEVGGIINSAGVVHDDLLINQSIESYIEVAKPKVDGGWNIHAATIELNLNLDFLVLFSSIASITGNISQANYVAANTFLDQLAFYRISNGLPTVSIDWGPWDRTGMTSDNSQINDSLSQLGILPINWDIAIKDFEKIMTVFEKDGGVEGVVAFDLQTISQNFPQNIKYYDNLIISTERDSSDKVNPLVEGLIEISKEERLDKVIELVSQSVSNVVHIDIVDVHAPLIEMGVTSLMAINIRNLLKKQFGKSIVIKPTVIFDYPSIYKLSGYIAQEISNKSGTKIKSISFAINNKNTTSLRTRDPVAIVGLSCRFPGGANDLEQFSDLLFSGKDAVEAVPKSRWDLNIYYDPNPNEPGKMYCKYGGFLQDLSVADFDASFFNISPAEATEMDPQQRIALELCWEALESANIPPKSLVGSKTGVYFGISTMDYADLLKDRGVASAYTNTGGSHSVLVGRIAYELGIEGPALSIDTACSSSLVAVHSAIQSLRNGEIDLAIVGGVNLMLTPGLTIGFCAGGFLSADGSCKTFDQNANGYVRGEGCGVLILKREKEAREDYNKIFGIIRGSAVNQDGASGGLTVPNGPSQQRVIRDALNDAGLEPKDISYIEAHGTGTPLGDPIEMHSLESVFGDDDIDTPLIVGSVKTNIGHLEAAAGVAGIIKVLLSFRSNLIPKHLHFETLNNKIDLSISKRKIEIPTADVIWNESHGNSIKKFAGVSSFAFQGTNAHVVLEGMDKDNYVYDQFKSDKKLFILPISAKSNESLVALVKAYIDLLIEPNIDLEHICATASLGRDHYALRIAVEGFNIEQIISHLQKYIETSVQPPVDSESARLYLLGEDVNWEDTYNKIMLRHTDLPSYKFDRKSYWVESPDLNVSSRITSHPLLGEKMAISDNTDKFIFNNDSMSINTYSYLFDHKVYGAPILPGAAYIELIYSAAYNTLNKIKDADAVIVSDLIIREPMVLYNKYTNTQVDREMQVIIGNDNLDSSSHQKKSYFVNVYSRKLGAHAWQCHASAYVNISSVSNNKKDKNIYNFNDAEVKFDSSKFYDDLKKRGLEYGRMFQGVKWAHVDKNKIIAKIAQPHSVDNKRYFMHPSMLDSIFQSLLAMVSLSDNEAFLPVSIDKVEVFNALGDVVIVNAYFDTEVEKGATDSLSKANIEVYSESGTLLMRVLGFTAIKISREQLSKKLVSQDDWMIDGLVYEVEWDKIALDDIVQNVSKTIFDKIIVVSDDYNDALVFSKGLLTTLEKLGLDVHTSSIVAHKIDQFCIMDYVEIMSENCLVIYYCGALDSLPKEEMGLLYSSCLKLIKYLSKYDGLSNLCVVTRNALLSKSYNSDLKDISSSVLTGLLRNARLECQNILIRQIDIPIITSANDSYMLDNYILRNINELLLRFINLESNEFVLGDENVLCPKLVRPNILQSVTESDAMSNNPIFVDYSDSGLIEDLSFKPLHKKSSEEISAHEVEIKVCASSINFRDVLSVMNLYPGNPGPLGGECAGVITALGSKVRKDLKIGDEVICEAAGTFATYVYTDEMLVVKKPQGVSFEEAAGIPIVFLTVYYAFICLANLKRGDKVLIHSGAGGVGQTAIQIAKKQGATVFATAGSEDKRSLSLELGADYVFSSRSQDFLDEIMEITNGEGVDVALNSLAGDFIKSTLDVVAKNGWFLEIGKRDIWSTDDVNNVRPDLRYEIIAIDNLSREDPNFIHTLLLEILDNFNKGTYHPIRTTVYDSHEVKEAINLMAKGKHTGKVVLRWDTELESSKNILLKPIEIYSNKAYIITGGTGGIGLEIGATLLKMGAGLVILTSRKGLTSSLKDKIKKKSAEDKIRVVSADISNEKSLIAISEFIAQEPGSYQIGGIIHAAGVLSDANLLEQTLDSYNVVAKPKVIGAFNIDKFLQKNDITVDFIIYFSSSSAVFGNIGQANYAAANGYLDALANYQRSLGINAISINWGPWAELGMAANMDKNSKIMMEMSGIKALTKEEGISVFVSMLSNPEMQDRSNIVVMNVDWSKILGSYSNIPQFLINIAEEESTNHYIANDEDENDENSVIEKILSFSSYEEKSKYITNILIEQIQLVTGDKTVVDKSSQFTEIGLDSLMVVEFRNRINKIFGPKISKSIPLTIMMSYPDIDSLSDYMIKVIGEYSSGNDVRSETYAYVVDTRENVDLRVFCIPYLGGSATAYAKLSETAPKEIDIVSIELPGRDTRSSEPSIQDYSKLVDDIYNHILDALDVPFVVYGHSLGAYIALALTNKIESNIDTHNSLIKSLVVTSPLSSLDSIYEQLSSRYDNPDDFLKILLDAGLLDLDSDTTFEALLAKESIKQNIISNIKNDLYVGSSLNNMEDMLINSNISVLYSKNDKLLSQNIMMEWRSYTLGDCDLYPLESGGHFFWRSNLELLIDIFVKISKNK